jgi:hypothetical protein
LATCQHEAQFHASEHLQTPVGDVTQSGSLSFRLLPIFRVSRVVIGRLWLFTSFFCFLETQMVAFAEMTRRQHFCGNAISLDRRASMLEIANIPDNNAKRTVTAILCRMPFPVKMCLQGSRNDDTLIMEWRMVTLCNFGYADIGSNNGSEEYASSDNAVESTRS